MLLTVIRHSKRFSHLFKNKRFKLQSVPSHVDPTLTMRDIQKLSKKVSNETGVYVLGTGAKQLPSSVILKTTTSSYLFNCGENQDKECYDQKYRLGVIDHIFCTYSAWNNVGGIAGHLMNNFIDVKRMDSCKIHGPPLLNKGLKILKHLDGQKNGDCIFDYVSLSAEKYEDHQLVIEYVVLDSDEEAVKSRESCDPAEVTSDVDSDTAESSSDKEDADVADKDQPTPHQDQPTPHQAVAYIIKLKDVTRQVMPAKLSALNLKSGPWVAEVVSGKTVEVQGKKVTPEDIFGSASVKARPIVVLQCPSVSFVDSLLSSDQLEDLTKTEDNVPQLIVHMTSKDIMKLPKYQDFMARYNTDVTKHLVMNEDCPGPFIQGTHHLQGKLNLLHNDIFPKLKGHLEINKPFCPPENGNIIHAVPGLMYNVRPFKKQGYDWDGTKYYNEVLCLSEALNATCTGTTVEEELGKLKKTLADIDTGVTEDYPEIVFLGTASSKPGKKRNVSAILVQMRKDEYLMLDCGEGTLVQMLQLYGEDKTNHILSNLKAIFITHLHHDHHGGLFSITERQSQVLAKQGREQEKINVLAPKYFKDRRLNVFNSAISTTYNNIKFCPLERSLRHEDEYVKELLQATNYSPVRVDHAAQPFGLVMEHKDGWKLVYSGDTMPCDNLIKHGKGCDILIHEATFEDSLEHLAKAKKHSTTGQALEVGRKMEAKFIILTHFSQRYNDLPFINTQENVGYAYDFMTVRPSQLKLLPLFNKAITAMFEEKQYVVKEKHLNKKRKLSE